MWDSGVYLWKRAAAFPFSLGAAALLGFSDLSALIFLGFFFNESLLLLPLKCWVCDCFCGNQYLQWKPPFTGHSQPLNRAIFYMPFRGNSSHLRKFGKYPVKHREQNRALILHFLHCNEVTRCFAQMHQEGQSPISLDHHFPGLQVAAQWEKLHSSIPTHPIFVCEHGQLAQLFQTVLHLIPKTVKRDDGSCSLGQALSTQAYV